MKLLPENQFVHSLDNVRQLGRLYGLTVTGYEEAASGIENTTLIVTASDATYVFRIYRHAKKTDEQIRAEIDFTVYLGVNGIPVAPIVANKQGRMVTIFEAASRAWQVIVMERVTGEHPKIVSDPLLADMAATQARIHQLATDYAGETSAIRRLTKLVETEFICQIDKATVDPRLQLFLERGAAYSPMLDGSLPTGICHLDYHTRNILSHNNAVAAVLDFDDMAVAPYVVCLANALWHMQDRQDQAAADNYLAFYEQVRPLSTEEKRFLPAAQLFRHYMITAIRILDGETSSDQIERYVRIEQRLLAAQQPQQ